MVRQVSRGRDRLVISAGIRRDADNRIGGAGARDGAVNKLARLSNAVERDHRKIVRRASGI